MPPSRSSAARYAFGFLRAERQARDEVVEHEVVEDDDARTPAQPFEDPAVHLGVVADVVERDVAARACRRAARRRRRRACGARERAAPSSRRCRIAREASGCSTRPSRALVEPLVQQVDQLQRRVVEHPLFAHDRLDVPRQQRLERTLRRVHDRAAQTRRASKRRASADRAVTLCEIAQLRPARTFVPVVRATSSCSRAYSAPMSTSACAEALVSSGAGIRRDSSGRPLRHC